MLLLLLLLHDYSTSFLYIYILCKIELFWCGDLVGGGKHRKYEYNRKSERF